MPCYFYLRNLYFYWLIIFHTKGDSQKEGGKWIVPVWRFKLFLNFEEVIEFSDWMCFQEKLYAPSDMYGAFQAFHGGTVALELQTSKQKEILLSFQKTEHGAQQFTKITFYFCSTHSSCNFLQLGVTTHCGFLRDVCSCCNMHLVVFGQILWRTNAPPSDPGCSIH